MAGFSVDQAAIKSDSSGQFDRILQFVISSD